jgi:hypothetical protein
MCISLSLGEMYVFNPIPHIIIPHHMQHIMQVFYLVHGQSNYKSYICTGACEQTSRGTRTTNCWRLLILYHRMESVQDFLNLVQSKQVGFRLFGCPWIFPSMDASRLTWCGDPWSIWLPSTHTISLNRWFKVSKLWQVSGISLKPQWLMLAVSFTYFNVRYTHWFRYAADDFKIRHTTLNQNIQDVIQGARVHLSHAPQAAEPSQHSSSLPRDIDCTNRLSSPSKKKHRKR